VAGLEADGGGEVDALVLMTADELFLDAELSSRLLDDFRRYRADYAFADGYPVGLAVEVLHPRILPALAALAAKHPTGLERGWLFRLIQKDINAFDIETLISPRDMRDLRLELACDTRRNTLLCERLLKAGVVDTETALALIPENLGLLRTLPAFIQVQVSGGCPQACLLCPWPLVGGDILSRRDFMPRRLFSRLMEAVSAFCGDAVIDLSLWGEPSLHPDIEGLVEEVLGRPGLSLILETSGLGWKPGSFERLAARWGGRIDWVVSLDASTPELYAKLRGEGFEEAVATARRLIALFPGTAHVQTVRAFDNEALLEEFWRGWKKETDNVIVQKYSTFAGFLPERRVTDLSPLHRRPCWHLKRDLSILIDGTVPLCRECVRSELLLGRLFEKGEEETIEASLLGARLAAVWEAGEEAHRRHIAASYPSPCEACDEYYTYNA
jgi:spiro-SPASM protein